MQLKLHGVIAQHVLRQTEQDFAQTQQLRLVV